MAQEFLELAAQYDKDRKVVEDGSDPAFVGSYGVSISLRSLMFFGLTVITSAGLSKPRFLPREHASADRTHPYRWINGTTGRRSDVAHHYLYPHRNNSNLQIVSGHYVKHVIFE